MATEKCLKDANALIAEFEWLQSQVSSTTALEIQEHIQRIKDAPTVDAVEVVHGRWIETLVPDGYVQKASRMRKKCSLCGWTNACRYHYCPNCGAKMDGEKDNG